MLLELRDIKKYFPVAKGVFRRKKTFVRAVDGVDLAILKGQNMGLVGESGSGKTTLARIILRLTSVDSGRIILDSQELTRLQGSRLRPYRRKMQMVFQDPYSSLDPRFTVRNILYEAMLFEGKKSREEREEKIRAVLSSVYLPGDVINRFPHEFSGGERQRIAIARALVMNPKLLILDEAVSSLDILVQDEIIKLLKEIQQRFDVTYLFISHNLRVIRKICQQVAVMYQGKIVELAPVEELFRNPLNPYTQALLSAAIEYKALPFPSEVHFSENSRLIDRGQGHFVIN